MLEQWFEGMLQLLPATLIISNTHTHSYIYIYCIYGNVFDINMQKTFEGNALTPKSRVAKVTEEHVHINTKWHS